MKRPLILLCLLALTAHASHASTDKDNPQKQTTATSGVSSKQANADVRITELSAGTVAAVGVASTGNGQLLAAQCFQCHGPNGHSKGEIDSIAGKSASDLYGDLIDMKQKPVVEIMHQQAKSYTDAELRAIADYLANLN